MALEWAALATVAAAEAVLLVFMTLPGLQGLRRGIISVAKSALRPLLAVVPLALFLMLDIYMKYDGRLKCDERTCSSADRERQARAIFKSQRNGLLVIVALLLYWLLYRVTYLLVNLERFSQQVKRLKE